MAPNKQLTLKEQLAGFPTWQIFIMSFARLAEPITFTSLFPYVYFMVKDFHIAKTESNVSRYVGYLSSTFALFEFAFSVQFGVYAEKYGRKVMLIFGLVGMAFSVLAFGFSKNYWMAMVARSFMGAFNGFCAVVRTVVGEIAVKKRHQAVAFSTLPLGWCIGSVIGPLIPTLTSSYHASDMSVYDPKQSIHYKAISAALTPTGTAGLNNLVDKYPYCLPNIVISIFLFTAALLLFLFLEETHETLKSQRDIGLILGDLIFKAIRVETAPRPWDFGADTDSVHSEALLIDDDAGPNTYGSIEPTQSKDSGSSGSSIESVGIMTRRQSQTIIDHYASRKNSLDAGESHSNLQSLWLPATFNTLVSSFMLSAHCLIFDEFLPVFLSLDVVREDPNDRVSPLVSKFPFKIVGGLGYSTAQSGHALAFTGLIGVLVVLFVFPYLDRKYNSVSVYRAMLTVFPVSYFLLPYLIFTLPPNKFTESDTFTTISVYSLFLLKTFGQSNAFPEIMLLVHRASPPRNRSFINGVLMSTTALARFFGPLVWGIIMSWANSREVGWVTWWALGAIATIGVFQVLFLKVPDDDEDGDDTENHDE